MWAAGAVGGGTARWPFHPSPPPRQPDVCLPHQSQRLRPVPRHHAHLPPMCLHRGQLLLSRPPHLGHSPVPPHLSHFCWLGMCSSRTRSEPAWGATASCPCPCSGHSCHHACESKQHSLCPCNWGTCQNLYRRRMFRAFYLLSEGVDWPENLVMNELFRSRRSCNSCHASTCMNRSAQCWGTSSCCGTRTGNLSIPLSYFWHVRAPFCPG